MVENISIASVRVDGGTQMRVGISQATVDDYAEHLSEGVEFPPVVVFYDGSDYWLADGFHRLNAYNKTGFLDVPAEVRSGNRLEAVRFALKANATNGKPRSSDDMRRGYQVICANELCDIADTKAVKDLLGCSGRWAQELTREARSKARQQRDSKIKELAAEGKSQREIAGEVGVSGGLVSKVARDHKRNTSENDHPEPLMQPQTEQKSRPQSRGVGVRIAHEAIAVLKRIPLDDGSRQDAFSIVQDWIETNRGN